MISVGVVGGLVLRPMRTPWGIHIQAVIICETDQGAQLSTQLLQTEQHGERPLQLPVEMDLVPAEPFQLVGVK